MAALPRTALLVKLMTSSRPLLRSWLSGGLLVFCGDACVACRGSAGDLKTSSREAFSGLLLIEPGGEDVICVGVIVRAEKAVGRNTGAGSSLGNDG